MMQPIDDRPAHSPLSESSYTLKVGWYGLGAMGYFMARNIATSGRAASPILVYNRTAAKAERLVNEIGTSAAIVASSPAQLVTECDIIFTNLSTNEVVQHVYSDFAKILSSLPTESKIFVDTSTISPPLAAEIDKLLISLSRCHFVASPIIGPPAAAGSGQLTIVMSGDYHCKKKVAHLLIPVGRKILDVGGNVERAPTLKLVCNGMLMSANELLAEVLTLGEKSGIGAQAVYNLMKEVMPTPSLIIYGDRMLNQHFDGTKGIAIDLGVSVLNDVCRLAVELNCPMPTIDIAHQSLVTARSIHEHLKQTGTNRWDVLDCSALIASRRVSAGLEPFESDNHRVTHED
ncbi:NAD(P)-binding protein [Pisolithus croceorrhizus]|nr:NAD(P)-binding protein [Pisolithus croceorrhizus]